MARLKKAERRELIIERATDVFMKHGLSGARTREIARSCGINEALLYKHFKSKEQLFREVMRRLHNEIANLWREKAAESPDGRSALLSVIAVQEAHIAANAGLCAGFVQGLSAATQDKETMEMAREWFNGHHEFIISLARRGIDDGSLPTDVDPELMAWWIRGAGWAAILSTHLEDGDPKSAAEGWNAYRAIVKYLSGSPRESAPAEAGGN